MLYRAIEGVIASDKMKAFSKSANRSVGTAGDKGDKSLRLAGENQSRGWATSINPEDDDPFIPAPCLHGSSGGGSDHSLACGSRRGLSRVAGDERGSCFESVAARGPPLPSASPQRLAPNRRPHEVAPGGEGGPSSSPDLQSESDSLGGGLAQADEALLILSVGLGGEEAVADAEQDDVAAADWLDVATALSGAGDETDEACSR